ncbi:MAG: DHHA1 domain-containing protein, partial [Bacteroidales bacterium]|nr:DHHA1 domain-containing protein [Bacteroidales bacterium]
PFYAESGGQVGDTGFIESASGERISIVNTVKENNLNIHISEKLPKNIHESFVAKIDTGRRQSIANNHTATHLLHRALREILGTHIEQKGSLVSNSHFRFDFSHFEKVSPEVIRQVENRVNELIRENKRKDEFRDVPVEEAKSMGAMALFGEKYGDKVRVIKFGDSIELCGGTHTSATGNIGLFKIMSESAIAAGVRRIEATTGESAEKLVQGNEDMLLSVRAMFNNSPNLAGSISKLVEENENYRRQVEEFMKERSAELKIKLTEDKQYINGVNVITLKGEFHPEIIKNLAFAFKTEGNTIFIAGYEFDKKANLALMYSDDLVAHGRNAGKDIREAAKLIEGGGGGQSFFATAGGKNADGISAAIAKLIELATK